MAMTSQTGLVATRDAFLGTSDVRFPRVMTFQSAKSRAGNIDCPLILYDSDYDSRFRTNRVIVDPPTVEAGGW